VPNRSAALLALAVSLVPAAWAASAPDGFKLIEEHCLACHGEAKMGGLDLRTRAAALAGGRRGPAVSPGDAAASRIYQAATHKGDLAMPPSQGPLPEDELAVLRDWIDAGAPWPQAAAAKRSTWWSFQKPERPPVPDLKVRNLIDAFLLAKLQAKGIEPLEAADRRTLIRRLTFDLHGLPPTPEEVDAFVRDPDPRAYEKLVDRLLDSPRYGERWGRRWLDVVRYADTGGFETDVYFANAWRYRDYVIESLNQDKPYDQFVREQVAADEIWPGDFDLEGSYLLPESKKEYLHKLLGTGLYTLGAFPVEITFHGDQYRAEWQAEAVDVTGAAFLGLTVGCARCHDHKFDPIPQRDYYRMTALFAGSEEREIPIVSRMGVYEFTRHQTKWTIAEQLADEIKRLGAPETPAERDRRETLLRQLGEAYMKAPEPYDKADVLAHTERVRPTFVLARGDWQNKGEQVEPGYLSALNAGPEIDEPETEYFVPRRRKALAEWLTSDDNPLLARVMVNRLWLGHFGRGLVDTPNDFGRQGSPPSNRELLDWLAVEFRESGWSMKHMHRLMVTSDAYRRSSAAYEANDEKDPENILLWRMNRRRLEAEQVRDAALAVSGTINLQAGGPAVVPPLTDEERDGMRDVSQWPVTSDETQHARRIVYLFVKLSFRLPMFQTFDAPDTALSCARRETSTVAPQALALMNGAFFQKQADAFAARLRKDAGDEPAAQVERAWRLALNRAPDAEETQRALDFLETEPIERLCLLVLNLSETLYVD
jgi:hypothetical protein